MLVYIFCRLKPRCVVEHWSHQALFALSCCKLLGRERIDGYDNQVFVFEILPLILSFLYYGSRFEALYNELGYYATFKLPLSQHLGYTFKRRCHLSSAALGLRGSTSCASFASSASSCNRVLPPCFVLLVYCCSLSIFDRTHTEKLHLLVLIWLTRTSVTGYGSSQGREECLHCWQILEPVCSISRYYRASTVCALQAIRSNASLISILVSTPRRCISRYLSP